MAERKEKVDEPQQPEAQADDTTEQAPAETPAAVPAATSSEYKRPDNLTRKPLSRRSVYVTDSRSGQKLPKPVPEHQLDQFPFLKPTPSKNKKAGK